MLSPHESVLVEVEEGLVTDGVTVQTSDATILKNNGFSVVLGEEDLIVESVEEGGAAALAGMLEGDVIVGVRLAGYPLPFEDREAYKLARFVLGNWDGPGLTLMVDQDGDPLELPLEW